MLAFALFVLLVQTPEPRSVHGQAMERRTSTPDSVRVLRSARSSQRSFEAFRRNRLPIIGSGGGHDCDVRIGRYCYWRGDETDEPKAPPEASDIVDRRNMLIKELENAAVVAPGDKWIAGQRVRYLVEAGRMDEAWQYAIRDCQSSQTWCLALAGYAAHRAQRFAQADSVYTESLAGMELAERCRWLDASSIMDDVLSDRFKQVSCENREQFVRHLLLVGAPLYSVSTTDLFSEYLARLTRARIAEGAATTDGASWGDDQRELVTRYGWPTWYSRSLPDFGSQQDPTFTGHDSGMPYNYLPPTAALDDVSTVATGDWKLDDRQARMGYSAAYLKTMHTVPSQIARFRRGDSTLVVAAWDARRDKTLVGRKFEAALVVAESEKPITNGIVYTSTLPLSIARQHNAGATGHISVMSGSDSGFVSLELLALDDSAAGRARIGIGGRSSGRVALSDLLLYNSSETAPRELASVQDSALASGTLPISKKVGVFWETYGLRAQGEPIHYTLTVEEAPPGLLRRVAERLRFADPTTSLRIQWQEFARPHDEIASRGVRVDLSRLHRGRYKMQVAVECAGDVAVASRDVDVP